MTFQERADANKLTFSQKLYPGRGIVIGLSPNGQHLFQIYWTMGRSQNSRNRIFVQEGDAVRNHLFRDDPAADTSLIIYYPMRSVGEIHVVSNGDQTDTICDFLRQGRTALDAMRSRTFEPDPPNLTPRISGIMDAKTGAYELSIVKSIENNEGHRQLSYYSYDSPIPGFGHCLTTYVDDGSPLPSFRGEPFLMELSKDLETSLHLFWELLNKENRISICAKSLELATGATEILLFNKNTAF